VVYWYYTNRLWRHSVTENKTITLEVTVKRTYEVNPSDYGPVGTISPEEIANLEKESLADGDVALDEVFDDMELAEVTVTVVDSKPAE
jgi:hypothetical protein